jgi:transposase InsO family protein
MKTEDEVLDRFREFSARVENLIEKKIEVLRLDSGGEYTSDDFSDFCKEAGIEKDSTVPYNPRQNGFVGRKKRSIMEDVEAMIHGQNLPMFLWA